MAMSDLTLESLPKPVEALEKQKLRIGSRDLKIAARRRSTRYFTCPHTEPISRECQACESRTGWDDGTLGWEGVGEMRCGPRFPSQSRTGWNDGTSGWEGVGEN